VKIFTQRLLSADTTEKVLNALISKVDNIRQMNIRGEVLPVKVKIGPNLGLPVNHPERKVIKYGENEIELTNMIGSIYIELKGDEFVDDALVQIKAVCDETIPHGYTIDVGRYSKYKPSLTDYMKG
jgi:methyl-coenzyme M reductase subunit D